MQDCRTSGRLQDWTRRVQSVGVVTMERSPDDAGSRWSDLDMKDQRLSQPSGWLRLTEDQGPQLLIEAFIDGAGREFNKSEIAEFSGVTRPTVDSHLDLLLSLNIVEEVQNTSPQRYQFDPESEVSQAILEVNGAVLANSDDLEW